MKTDGRAPEAVGRMDGRFGKRSQSKIIHRTVPIL
jgi:hypothetical protein